MNILNTLKRDPSFKKRLSRRKLRGLSLVETLLVVGVIVIVLVGILVTYSTVQNNLRATQLTTQTTQLVGGLQRAYATAPSYDTGDLVAVLDGGGDIPTRARRVDSSGTVTIENPYGGAVTVVGDGAQSAVVTLNDIPQTACERFLEAFIGLGATTSDLESVTVGTTNMTLPLTRSAIATNCIDGDNDVALGY